MTLTLEMPSSVRAGLEHKAARLGLPVDLYVLEVLRRDAAEAEFLRPGFSPEARQKLEELASGTRAGLPALSEEALSKDSIYDGRGE